MAAGLLLVVIAFLLLLRRTGELAIPLIVVAVVAVVVLLRPGWALALVLASAVAFEDTAQGGTFPIVPAFYDVARVVSPLEALVALAVAATALDVTRRGELRTPGSLTPPLMLLGAAIPCGIVVGLYNGAAFEDVRIAAGPLVVVLVMPFVVVNVVRDRETLRRVLLIAAFLVTVKAGIGVGAVIAGQGTETPVGGLASYFEGPPNWIMLAFVLVFASILVDGRRPPLWMLASAILATTSLVLSYRRSFWVAGVAALLIVLLIGGWRLQWRSVVPGLAILAAAIWLTFNTGVVGDLSGPLAERAQSLTPSELEANVQDRYRLDERRNVLADLEIHPITGLGLAVPWTGRFPPSVDRPRTREYVHFTALWWWLKLGLLGLIAYVWLVVASIWTSFRVWVEQTDQWLRPLGLGVAAALIGLALIETTVAFTGVTARFSAVIGAAIGLLVVALRDARLASGSEHA